MVVIVELGQAPVHRRRNSARFVRIRPTNSPQRFRQRCRTRRPRGVVHSTNRCIALVGPHGEVRLQSRQHRPLTSAFPDVVHVLARAATTVEAVVGGVIGRRNAPTALVLGRHDTRGRCGSSAAPSPWVPGTAPNSPRYSPNLTARTPGPPPSPPAASAYLAHRRSATPRSTPPWSSRSKPTPPAATMLYCATVRVFANPSRAAIARPLAVAGLPIAPNSRTFPEAGGTLSPVGPAASLRVPQPATSPLPRCVARMVFGSVSAGGRGGSR
jgi:hypothetical protein